MMLLLRVVIVGIGPLLAGVLVSALTFALLSFGARHAAETAPVHQGGKRGLSH